MVAWETMATPNHTKATAMSSTFVTITFEVSQPLTPEQLEHVRAAVNTATQCLPGKDKEDFLDIPEFTCDADITQA